MKTLKVIMHNSVSLDGSFTDFEVNMGLHYKVASRYKADANLIGSNTIVKGIEIYGGEIPPEKEVDYDKPDRDTALPYWVIADTKGITKGMLHTCRSFEYCKDVIVLISQQTREDYINYLRERDYDYFICGEERIDFKKALNILSTNYEIQKVLVDSGPILNEILISEGLLDEISLLISPTIVGNKSNKSLSNLNFGNQNINLELLSYEGLESGLVLLRYKVLK